MSFDTLSASYPDHSSMNYFVYFVFAQCLHDYAVCDSTKLWIKLMFIFLPYDNIICLKAYSLSGCRHILSRELYTSSSLTQHWLQWLAGIPLIRTENNTNCNGIFLILSAFGSMQPVKKGLSAYHHLFRT